MSRLAASSIKLSRVPGLTQQNCSQMKSSIVPMQIRPSWISSIVPSSVLHEYRQLFPDASFMNIVSGWVLHEYRQLFVNRERPASCRVQHPAPCTQDASCILHISVPWCISVLYPASIVSSLDGCILHWHCCTSLTWTALIHCSACGGHLFFQRILSIRWATDPTPTVHIPGTSPLRRCQSQYGIPTCKKIETHYRMFRNLHSECALSAGTRPTPNCSSNLIFLLLSCRLQTKILHGLFEFSSWYS